MGHLRLGEHIDAPIDHVWEIYASCERLPEWDMSIVEVKDCQGRLDRVGARVTTVARVFGRRIEGFRETTKADQPHDFAVKLVARVAPRRRWTAPSPGRAAAPTRPSRSSMGCRWVCSPASPRSCSVDRSSETSSARWRTSRPSASRHSRLECEPRLRMGVAGHSARRRHPSWPAGLPTSDGCPGNAPRRLWQRGRPRATLAAWSG